MAFSIMTSLSKKIVLSQKYYEVERFGNLLAWRRVAIICRRRRTLARCPFTKLCKTETAFDFFDSRRILPRACGVALRKPTCPVGTAGGKGKREASFVPVICGSWGFYSCPPHFAFLFLKAEFLFHEKSDECELRKHAPKARNGKESEA